MLFCDFPSRDQVLGEITVHPDLDYSPFVDSKVLLLNLEAAIAFGDVPEAEKGLLIEVEVVREGDVFDIGESDGDSFDEEGVSMAHGAKLLLLLLIEVEARDHFLVFVPEMEDLFLLFELFFTPREDIVLFNLNTFFVSVPPEGVVDVFLEEFPVMPVERVLMVIVVTHALLLLFYELFKFIPSDIHLSADPSRVFNSNNKGSGLVSSMYRIC